MSEEKLRETLKEIYTAGLEAVDPESAVLRHVRREGDVLRVGGQGYRLGDFRKVFLIGFGKAGVPMARALESLLGDRLESGRIIVKHGHGGELEKTKIYEAGHPEPDAPGLEAARELLEHLERNVGRDDLLLVVVSGGGSALFPVPVEGISFEEKKGTTSVLLRCGADIHEINAIRKHLSRAKGGRLLKRTGGARVVALLLSDVVGDELASIASGPTVPDPSTFEDCKRILRRYEIAEEIPPAVRRYLEEAGSGQETIKPGDPILERVQNLIVGSNIQALEASAKRARELGYPPLILSSSIAGNNSDVALLHVAVAREVLSTGHPASPPCCIISGGETTVRVRGDGKGGRSQEFALWCARETARWSKKDVLFASLGTDGTDGPTDAAGALAFPSTAERAIRRGISLDDHLDRNDSYHFFKALGDLIVTGPTRTNVMDLRFILVAPS